PIMDKLLKQIKMSMIRSPQLPLTRTAGRAISQVAKTNINIHKKGVNKIMNICKLQLINMKNDFVKLRDKYMAELNAMPAGALWVDGTGNRKQYYMGAYINGKRNRKCINKDQRTINLLARKKFLEMALKEIDGNIMVLDRAVREFHDCDPKDIIAGMTAAYKTLSTDCFFDSVATSIGTSNANATGEGGPGEGKYKIEYSPEEEFFMTEDELARARYERHAAWANEDYERSSYMPEGLIEITSRGERVRTKSEMLIAETLYKYNIPFRYEDATDYAWLGMIPDFTFRERGMKKFYLEYCGMMDDEEYVRKFLNKRRKYEELGICDWKNIIYIHETGNQVNMAMIDA
ncbi:MAG: hypothetical protein HUJ76_08880, partial [Parasporobacterium sp.]|nr:hypothetical protein [Parasporobacterium sp.]